MLLPCWLRYHISILLLLVPVDSELRPSVCKKHLSYEANVLRVYAFFPHTRVSDPSPASVFNATDPHSLRISVSSFFDFLQLTVRTLETFGASS